jgi:hypothetical protein
MNIETYRQLAQALSSWFSQFPVHCQGDRPRCWESIPLDHVATFLDYVVLNGSRYYASCAVGSNRASLVKVQIGPSDNLIHGEILDLIQFKHNTKAQTIWVAHMRWFRAWDGPQERIWDDLCVTCSCRYFC